MKTQYLAYVIIATCIILTSCSLDVVIASDDITTEERVLSNFNEVEVSNDIQIVLLRGATQSVKVTTSDNLQNRVITTVTNGKLSARLSGNISGVDVLRVEITMPMIRSLKLSSDSYGTFSGFENLDAFRLDVSSDAFITLSGSATSMNIDASSDARVEGFDFQTKTCNINCSSDATVSITCTEVLTGSATSDAIIFYKGTPELNVSTSSDGAVIDSN
ncbi:MAG: head GIN domain-containing protein [Jejuia sp.]